MSNIIIHFQYKRYYLQCSAVCTAITDPLSTLKIIAIYSVQFILYILSALERLVCTVLSALKRKGIEIFLTFFSSYCTYIVCPHKSQDWFALLHCIVCPQKKGNWIRPATVCTTHRWVSRGKLYSY